MPISAVASLTAAVTSRPVAEPLTEGSKRRRRQAAHELMRRRVHEVAGDRVRCYEPDDVTIRLPFREDLTNDGTYYHGGVIAAVMIPQAPLRRGRTMTSRRARARPRSR